MFDSNTFKRNDQIVCFVAILVLFFSHDYSTAHHFLRGGKKQNIALVVHTSD